MTTRNRRLGIGALAFLWLAIVLSWVFDLGISHNAFFGWVAFFCVVGPPLFGLHLLARRVGATRSPRRPPDAQ